jgi:molecular chaperone GrpE
MNGEQENTLDETVEMPQQSVEEEESYQDKYFRLLAEMENLRKRLHKEKIEANKYAVRGILRDVLAPFESMENALKFAMNLQGEVRQWAEGFVMILEQFKEILASHGVESFDSVGTVFDPHKHEAIDIEETNEVEAGIVLEEYQKGFSIDGHTLRPARVKVAKAKQ